MRQFGLKQMKPPNCDTRRDLHRTDMRGREGYDFEKLHLHHVLLWRDRNQDIIQGEPFDGIMADDDPYLVWYREITRLRIGNPSQKQEERYVEKEDIIKSIVCARINFCISITWSSLLGYNDVLFSLFRQRQL